MAENVRNKPNISLSHEIHENSCNYDRHRNARGAALIRQNSCNVLLRSSTFDVAVVSAFDSLISLFMLQTLKSKAAVSHN
jgi:hypothetical protein